MSSWADESEDNQPQHSSSPPHHGGGGFGTGSNGGGGGGGPPQRPRLQLKPRSVAGVKEAEAHASHRKSNPFGAAKPREEVLAQKGVDPKLVDQRLEKKASVVHLSKEQEQEVEAIRAELTKAEEELRDANEKELPEEKFRVVCEAKKKELNDLMAKFAEINLKKREEPQAGPAGGAGGAGGHRKYERPSERRRRLEEERGGGGSGRGHGHGGYHDGEDGDDPFSSFGGRSRQHGGSGRRHDGDGYHH